MQRLYSADAEAARAGWTPDTLYEAARGWRAVGDLTTAAAYTERALASADADWGGTVGALRFRVEIALEGGDWARAVDGLTALRDHPNADPSAVNWAAFQLVGLRAPYTADVSGDLDFAAREPAYRDLVTALRRVAGDPLRVGIALIDGAMWDAAAAAFGAAVDAASDPIARATALAYQGWARAQTGLDGGAQIVAAVALAPDQVVVRYLQGLYLREVGDDRGSLNALIVAAALNPLDAALYAELGAAYARVGDAESADRWLNEAVRLSRGDPRFSALLGEFRAAHAESLQDYIGRMLPFGVELPARYRRNAPR